jgi:predicted component of type VI protein secretion system
MKLSLLVLTSGKMEGQVLEIKLSQFLIGRDPQCHLRPASPLISKRHCAILQREGKAFIRDFESTNGTLVNDEPVQGERELHHDDQLKVGPLLFTVRLEADSPAARPLAGKTPPPATRPAARVPGETPAPLAKAPTPAPATKPSAAPAATKPIAPAASRTPVAEGTDSEDDLMAMLMSAEEGGGGSSDGVSEGPVPEGSTIMDMKVDEPGAGPKPDEKSKKQGTPGDTRAAAASILAKMHRRNRT